jgi:hypothetical protein
MAIFAPGGEEVVVRVGGRGAGSAIVAAQNIQQTWGEHGVAIFAALALLYTNEAAFGIDIADSERDGFADAQACAVTDHEGGAVLEAWDVVEEGQHFLVAEHNRKLAGAPWAGEVVIAPGHFQGHEIKELHGRNELPDGVGGDPALVQEIQLILADGLDVEHFWAFAEVLGETGHVSDILLLGADCEIAQLHIIDHALS